MRMYLIVSIFFIVATCSIGIVYIESLVIQTSNGLIRGYNDETESGKVYSAFEGIPYAKPPTGELRFQAPKEIENWQGFFEANKRYCCRYFLPNPRHLDLTGIEVSEDCLRLNVYVPKMYPSQQDKFDVIVHIHGGGFMIGHPHTLYGPKFLMTENVIYVSLTYRVGPLGFLSTEDDVIPGNNGMKDQSMALKWIHNNIEYFGGNPKSITLTGLSAGGASVHLHYFSALSRGLFQRGYSASGTALDPWVLQEAAFEKAKRLAALVGCNFNTSVDMLSCLKMASYQSLFDATQMFLIHDTPFSPFAPVIEYPHKGAFLAEHPYKLLMKGHVADLPWLVDFSIDDGIFPAGAYYFNLNIVEEDWLKFAPQLLDYNYTAPEHQKDIISMKIKKQYFGNNSITYHKLIKVCSDRHFFRGAENSINLQNAISNSSIYLILFAYRGEYSYSQLFGVPDTELGVSHGDDTIYYTSTTVFGKFNEKDEKVKDVFVKIITSFARTGVPHVDTLEWKPTTSEKINYLYFDGYENLKMNYGEDFGTIGFWRSLNLDEMP